MPSVYWPNNKCGNCGLQTPAPLEKLVCTGEQAGVECCRACGFAPEAPEVLHITRSFLREKINKARARSA